MDSTYVESCSSLLAAQATTEPAGRCTFVGLRAEQASIAAHRGWEHVSLGAAQVRCSGVGRESIQVLLAHLVATRRLPIAHQLVIVAHRAAADHDIDRPLSK